MDTYMEDLIGFSLIAAYIINLLTFYFSKNVIIQRISFVLLYGIPAIAFIIGLFATNGTIFLLSFILYALYLLCAYVI